MFINNQKIFSEPFLRRKVKFDLTFTKGTIYI